MQTIRIPKNLLFLSDKLPLPNYENKINNSGELPEIRKINQRKKPKNKDNHQEINDDNSNLSEIQTVNINKKHTRENSNIENNINYNNNNNINNQIKNSNLNINNEEENNIIPNKNKVIDKKERSPSG